MPQKYDKKILTAIAIICLPFACWGDTINNVCLSGIYAAFNNSNTFLQGYIVTGPYFISIPLVLILGKYADKFDKKKILLMVMGAYMLGGVACAFSVNILMFAIFRTISGICVVLIAPLAFSIMFENFPNSKDSAKIMGLFQAFSTVYGSILAIVAGLIAVNNWRNAQYLNAITIISIILALLFIQGSPREIKTKEVLMGNMDKSSEKSSSDINKKGMAVAIVEAAAICTLNFVFYYYVAVYVSERGLGTTALAGALVSALTVGSFFASVLFAKYYKKFRRYSGIIAAFISALSFVLLGLNVPVWTVFMLAFLNGLTCGIVNAFYPIAVNLYAPSNKIAFFQGLYTAVNSIGITFCAYVPRVSMLIFGGGYQRSMLVTGIVMVISICLISLLLKKSYK